MTDNTQPEAMDLADWLEAVGGGPSAKRCAALLRRQHARIAELESEQEAVGAGGVQALSAAPVAFLKSVIALCSHRGYSPANIEVWDKDDKWIADLWRQAESMLAASPTPTAEQQAKLGAVYAELPKRRRQFLCTKCGSRECKVGTINEQHPPCECGYLGFAEDLDFNADEMRDFADRTHALRQAVIAPELQAEARRRYDAAMEQAAPKAAPVEQDDHQILAITTAYEQGVGKGHQAYKSGKEIANPYDSAYGCDLAWQYGYREGKEQAKRAAQGGKA